jgi:hypothetical protein
MVDPIIDAPDQTADATSPPAVPAEIPVGKTQERVFSTKGDSLTAQQGDAFSRILDPANYQALTGNLANLTSTHIKEQEEMTGRELAQAAQYDARQERALSAMGASMDDIKPWNVQEQMAKYSHNLWEDFGSPGFLIGMLASAFTTMPMVSALNAGGAAINAINEGDEAGYHKAFDAWKVNTDLTLKRMEFEQDAFNDIDHLRKNRMDEWHVAAEAAAARFNDTRLLAMLHAGMDPDAIKVIQEMSTLRENLSDSADKIKTNEIKRQFVNAHLVDENGKPTAAASDPRKWAELRAAADEIFNTPKTMDQQIYHQLVTSDAYLNADSKDQQQMLADALKKVQDLKVRENYVQAQIAARQAAYHLAHPGDSPEEAQAADDRIASEVTLAYAPAQAAKIEIDKEKVEETKRQHDMTHDIAEGRLDAVKAAEDEKEKHNRNVETIQASKVDVATKLADEKIRYDQVQEQIKVAAQEEKTRHAKATEQATADKLEEIKRRNDQVNKIAENKLTVSQASENEKELHNRNVEKIQNSKSNVQEKLAAEKIRHDQAQEVLQAQRLNPFATEIKGEEDDWQQVRGAPVTSAMDALIQAAYNTRGNSAAPRRAQVQGALDQIRRMKEDGEEPSDQKQETILREATQRPVTMGTEPLSKEELATLGWPQESLDLAANVYRKMGKLPGNLGTRQYAGKIQGAIIQRANELTTAEGKDPGLLPQQWALYQAQRVGMARYLSGPQAQVQRSLNVVVAHLDTIDELSDALHNHDYVRANQLKNIISVESGGKAVPDFDAAKQIVGTEIVKALGVAGGGASGERYEAARTFDATKSADVIKSVTATLRGMLVPQLEALRAQFTPATSLPVEMFDSELLPRTQQALRINVGTGQTEVINKNDVWGELKVK